MVQGFKLNKLQVFKACNGLIQALMLVDIFSSFDPHVNYLFVNYPRVFWLLHTAVVIIVAASYWVVVSRIF